MTERNCATCRYARWQMTNHNPPRVNSQKSGECTYKIDIDHLIPATVPAHVLDWTASRELENKKTAIWYRSPLSDCPVWAPIEQGESTDA